MWANEDMSFRAVIRVLCEYLSLLSTSERQQKEQLFHKMCRGWALGTREFKKGLVTEECVVGAERLGHESREARELYWESLCSVV